VKYHVVMDGEHREVLVERKDDGFAVTVDGQTLHMSAATLADGNAYSLLIESRSVDVGVEERGDALELLVGGRRYSCDVLGEREWLARSIQPETEDGDKTITAVMTGIVKEVGVEVGQAVTRGQTLFILEAMKMENEVKAEVDGTVAAIAVEPGVTVDIGDVVMELD